MRKDPQELGIITQSPQDWVSWAGESLSDPKLLANFWNQENTPLGAALEEHGGFQSKSCPHYGNDVAAGIPGREEPVLDRSIRPNTIICNEYI